MTGFTLILPGEIPTLRASKYRPGGHGMKNAMMAERDKRRAQQEWRAKLKFAEGADGRGDELVHSLQRECAAAGRKIKLAVFLYRRVALDKKNRYTAPDELILDPIQFPRENPPLYNDRDSNLDWASHFVKVQTLGECRVVMIWGMSDIPCGETTRRRFREEQKKKTPKEGL